MILRDCFGESYSVMSDSLWARGLYSPWNSPGQNTGVGSLSLLQGIISTQGLGLGLQIADGILYQLSHQGSPRILEWVACPFSSRSSQPRNRTQVSCIAGGFLTNWALMETILSCLCCCCCYLIIPAVIIRALFRLIVPLGYKKKDFFTLCGSGGGEMDIG